MTQFSYQTAEKELIPCNFCGTREFTVLAKKDHDGLDVDTVLCKKCGLIFINPRMTKEWHERYYQEEYRTKKLIYGCGRQDVDLDKLFTKATSHGEALFKVLGRYLKLTGPTIEIGSSTGGVLNGMKKFLQGEIFGIEPSAKEADYANQKGITTYTYLIEDSALLEKQLPKFSNIISTQALNHFLDPRHFLVWSHDNLADDGRLVIEVMNFRHQAEKAGYLENAAKIDHVYMFTPEVLEDFVKSAGFDILFFDVDENKNQTMLDQQEKEKLPNLHIRLVAAKSSRPPFKQLFVKSNNYAQILKSLNPIRLYSRYLFFHRLKSLL